MDKDKSKKYYIKKEKKDVSFSYFEQLASLSQRVHRHERWIQQIAEKFDIKLSY